jgi:flagellar protein FlbD
MIRLTRLNHVPVVLNSDLIEHIDVTPDTVITLTTGQKIVVLESADEVIERVVRFRRLVGTGPRRYIANAARDDQTALDPENQLHGN